VVFGSADAMRHSAWHTMDRIRGEQVMKPRVAQIVVLALVAAAYAGALGFKVLQAAEPSVESHARLVVAAYMRPSTIPAPKENAHTPEREALGRTLFFDPRLSASEWISCATCHNPALSWGDGLPRSIGHGMKTLGRRTPTILNLAWAESFFWDGRADSLEQQALGPIEAAGEMNLPLDQLVGKLREIAGYRTMFEKAYSGEGITRDTIAKAIANFERTAVSGIAPFDRWAAGDESALSEQAKRGFVVFNEQGRCATCHQGWRFTDDSFHDIGVETDDVGRGKLLADIPPMQSAFKTPTLRNADHRGPYMHNGSVATLAAVVDLYDRGGLARRPSLSPEIKPLGLSDRQKQDLVAFLHTLTSEDRPMIVPMLPR
jgi:cytochrome c peroxidase